MALGPATFTAVGGAVSDLFSASAFRTKAAGSRIEAQEYDLAGTLARQNKQYTETSTELKTYQADRALTQTLGGMKADVAGSGFAMSGSALDLMRDSATQGAITKAVIGQQGLIEEAGFEEQAKSYDLMASASRMAADADEKAATGLGITAAIKGVAAVASLFSGGILGGGASGGGGAGGGAGDIGAAVIGG